VRNLEEEKIPSKKTSEKQSEATISKLKRSRKRMRDE
jgi:hypothetical protein